MVATNPATELHIDAREGVEQRLLDLMAAARAKDIELLESYHLFGPEYTKFDDFEPLERQDAETSQRLEREAILGAKEFIPHVDDLKVDVFGLVALTTFIFNYDVITEEDEALSFKARATMAFVSDGTEWKVVHEHFSPFKAQL